MADARCARLAHSLFWFLFPVSLVICNDSMAYFAGMAFGRKFITRPFLGDLSPNKTWEGFIGGGICTCIFAFLTPPFYPTALICPCEELRLTGGSVLNLHCEVRVCRVPCGVRVCHVPCGVRVCHAPCGVRVCRVRVRVPCAARASDVLSAVCVSRVS